MVSLPNAANENLSNSIFNFSDFRLEDGIFDFSQFELGGRCSRANTPSPIFGAVMIALVVVGLVGNSLVFFTIMILREYKKSVTNWYILQLTLADTLFLLMLPFTAHSEIIGKWEFSVSLCKFKEAVIFINYYASIYFLVVMSFDRYLAVTKAFASNYWVTTLRSPTASYVISIVGWILSALLCIQLYNYSKVDICGVCKYEFPEDNIDPASRALTSFYSPIAEEDGQVPELPSGDFNQTEFESSFLDLFNYFNDTDELLDIFTSEDYPFDLGDNENDIDMTDTDGDSPTEQTDEDLRKFLRAALGNQIDNDGIRILLELSNFTNSSAANRLICSIPESRELKIWLYGNFIGAYVVPFVLICFFYGMIMQTITKASSIGDNEKQRSYRRRVTLIVLALVSLFGISWLPWYVEKLVKVNGIDLSQTGCDALTNAVRAIAYLNSAFNPYFYSFLGFHFRERLKRASGQVRLLSSLRSRATVISSIRRKRQSSSNSVGSMRAPMAPPMSNTNGTAMGNRVDTPRGSIAQSTQRTLV